MQDAQSGSRAAKPLRVLVKTLLIAGGLLALAVAASIFRYLRADYLSFRNDLDSYQGVSIGDTKDQVRYALGVPKGIYGPPHWDATRKWRIQTPIYLTPNGDLPGAEAQIPGGSALKEADTWIYEAGNNYTVAFDPQTSRVIQIQCMTSVAPEKGCASNQGISSFSGEDEIVARLGKPDLDQLTGGFKSIEYRALGLRFMLQRRELYSIAKTRSGGAGFAWWLMHRVF